MAVCQVMKTPSAVGRLLGVSVSRLTVALGQVATNDTAERLGAKLTLHTTGVTELEQTDNKEPAISPGPVIVSVVKFPGAMMVKMPPPPVEPELFPDTIWFPATVVKQEVVVAIDGIPPLVSKLKISSAVFPVAVNAMTRLLTGWLNVIVYEKVPFSPSHSELAGVVTVPQEV